MCEQVAGGEWPRLAVAVTIWSELPLAAGIYDAVIRLVEAMPILLTFDVLFAILLFVIFVATMVRTRP